MRTKIAQILRHMDESCTKIARIASDEKCAEIARKIARKIQSGQDNKPDRPREVHIAPLPSYSVVGGWTWGRSEGLGR